MECPLSNLSFLVQWNCRVGCDWWFGENSRDCESCMTRKDRELKQLDNRLSKEIYFSTRLNVRSNRGR